MTKQFKPPFKKAGTIKTFDPTRERDQKMHWTPEWKKFSHKYLELNPECYTCGEKSEVTDHIRVSRGQIEWFWRDGNYLPLCIICHNTVTAKFDSRSSGSEHDVSKKVGWMNEQRSKNQIIKERIFLKPKYVSIKDFKVKNNE